jgi:hypothetical protein
LAPARPTCMKAQQFPVNLLNLRTVCWTGIRLLEHTEPDRFDLKTFNSRMPAQLLWSTFIEMSKVSVTH